MALKLIKSNGRNAVAGFIPNWYAVYRDGETIRTISLGIPLRGLPPTSGNLKDKGNREFERSRKDAQAELDRRIQETKERQFKIRAAEREKGDAIRETAEIIERKTGRKFEDPKLTELAAKYLDRLGERSRWHIAMIESCFAKFADFAHSPTNKRTPSADTLMQVTDELATAFFRQVAKEFSFSTVKRWASVLSGAFSHFAPIGMANPFEGARLAAVGRAMTKTTDKGEKVNVETVIHHRPLDRQQLRQLCAEAKKDPLLYHLAITTVCTGLRVGDACQLKFADCDLKNGIVTLTTAKTGTKVSLPIFDYDPKSPNYEPVLGEFRRHLETALTEVKDNEPYVCPKAAHLYQKTIVKDGKTYYPGRDAIYAKGKALFAKALFKDDAAVSDAQIVSDNAAEPSTDDVCALIRSAVWTDKRKKRVTDIYTRYAHGETYCAIQKATGYAKSTISTDLGAVERLARISIKQKSDGQSIKDLLRFTRQERAIGQRSASIYSWHSIRGSFVVLMLANQVPIETCRLLVGHATVAQTCEYNNPTTKIAAENTKLILANRNHPTATTATPILATMIEMWQKLDANDKRRMMGLLQVK